MWSGLDSDSAIEALVELYGADASVAAAWCAFSARMGGQQTDYESGGGNSNLLGAPITSNT